MCNKYIKKIENISKDKPIESLTLLLVAPIMYVFANILQKILLFNVDFMSSMIKNHSLYVGSSFTINMILFGLIIIYRRKIINILLIISYYISEKIYIIYEMRIPHKKSDSLMNNNKLSEFSDKDE